MNADRLMEHFERISDAPDAVDRLRRFILDLAVRGKVVEQDPRESSEPSEAPAAEEPFPLPSNWSCVALGGVLHMINGRAFKPSDWLSKGLPIVRIQNLNNESAPFNCCDPKGVDEKNIINTGTFLISWSGTPGTSFGAFIWQRGKAALNQHIFKCLPAGTEYLDRFLQLAINGRLDEMIAKAHGGVGLQHITKGKLEALALPLPPLTEQHRIVEKVDELMTLCDRLEASHAERESRRDRLVMASLNRLSQPTDPDEFEEDAQFQLSNLNRLSSKPEHIKEIRKAILNLAVRGKLVPQDEREGTAEELPAANPDEPISRQIKSSATRQLENVRGPCFVLPPSWEWTTVGGVVQAMRYGTSKKCNRDPRGVPVLRIPNVSKGAIDCSDLKYGPLTATEVQELGLEQGDLLIIRSNGSLEIVGRAALITPEAAGMCYAGYLVRLRPNACVLDPRYMWYTLKAPYVRQHIEGPIRTTVGLKNINSKEIARLPFPLPPLAEQKRIVAKVDELMAICDQLEQQLEYQQKGRRQLLESLLHEVLEGVG